MKKIILGSASPRRKELLSALGFDFEVRVKDTDESCPTEIPITQRAEYIATKKAKALESVLAKDEILICADTIVVLGEKVLNKPTSKADAFDMLSALSGQRHQVITGFIVLGELINISRSVVTFVEFKTITPEEINQYIEKFNPLDKAGAYGIQEWIGHAFIDRIEGSYTNVVGLPTAEVYAVLKPLIKS